jgi:hypothetical protein
MSVLIEILIVFTLFFAVNYLAWLITEKWGLPEWLQYKPWSCRLCLTFWSLIFIYSTIWLSFSCLIGIVGNILAILNALAMWIDQKQKTIKLEDYTKDFKIIE